MTGPFFKGPYFYCPDQKNEHSELVIFKKIFLAETVSSQLQPPTSCNPLITIVIPTYNRLAFVQQAIASVIAQTYAHWELIVVDDGSDDGTTEDIICSPDHRVRYLLMQHSGNIAGTAKCGG